MNDEQMSMNDMLEHNPFYCSTVGQGFITEIHANGSKWFGHPVDSIEELINVLNEHPLDPTFEKYGNFISVYKPIQWTERNLRLKGTTCFWGNFLNISHVFRIFSTASVFERLTNTIRANQRRLDYIEARTEKYLA